MKLTQKDGEFLERLRALLDEKDLAIELREDDYKRLVLRKNYGDRIERDFGMTRQGVRWRFQRIFGDIYPSAYESILYIESHFGADLRGKAMAIAKERAELRRRALVKGSLALGTAEGKRW